MTPTIPPLNRRMLHVYLRRECSILLDEQSLSTLSEDRIEQIWEWMEQFPEDEALDPLWLGMRPDFVKLSGRMELYGENELREAVIV